MKTIFDQIQIGNLKCKNRILRSATWEALSDEKGFMSEKQYEVYEELAQNEIGLIATGYARVMEEVKALDAKDFEKFLRLVRISGRSSAEAIPGTLSASCTGSPPSSSCACCSISKEGRRENICSLHFSKPL